MIEKCVLMYSFSSSIFGSLNTSNTSTKLHSNLLLRLIFPDATLIVGSTSSIIPSILLNFRRLSVLRDAYRLPFSAYFLSVLGVISNNSDIFAKLPHPTSSSVYAS